MRIAALTILVLSTTLLLSCSNADSSKLLIGKWAFLKFYTESETTKEMDAELESYNSLNKGLTIRFSPQGEYESDQPGGDEGNNKISDYKLLPGNKLVIEDDTIQIVNVDQSFLTLYKDESSPNVMFRRVNNTGTEPGRR